MTNMEERTPEIAKEYLEHYKIVKCGMMPEWVWDMAIKALGQEPCEDCISRKAVLDYLTASGLKKFDFILDARDKIKNLPPVTQKPKTEVLDKIRAEIDGAEPPKNQMSFFRDGIDCALQIIDKYKAESEDKE